jgi:hypothetical protein
MLQRHVLVQRVNWPFCAALFSISIDRNRQRRCRVAGTLMSSVKLRTAAPAVLVVLLHSSDSEQVLTGLKRTWERAVPAANVTTMFVADCGSADEILAQLANRLAQAGLDAAHLVLAGVCGAEHVVLQLVLGSTAFACAGVLACGEPLLPFTLLAEGSAGFAATVRLVWKAEEPLLYAAALGESLRCFRAAGMDAQGAVVPGQKRSSEAAHGNHEPGPALVRLGGAYLAELVAVALCATRPAIARSVAAARSDDCVQDGHGPASVAP